MPVDPDPDRRPLDRILDALGDVRRRRVLDLLATADPGETVRLESAVAADAEDRELTALYHVHLPKLVNAGYVSWTPETDVIGRGQRFDEAAPVLELFATHEPDLPVTWP